MPDHKFTLEISAPAQNDIDNILLYTLSRWGNAQLVEYSARFDKAFAALQVKPHSGRVRHGRMVYHVGQHSIFYKTTGSTVYVLRVLHQRMDVIRHL